jgi:DNA-binding SARP family transcriptional activator/tetratricopeptide (TPR) repeat protein
MTVEFRLLGDIAVSVDGRPVDVGHARQQCVLVALLVDLPHVVTVDQLVERVWGYRPPRRPHNALYGYISRLRNALAVAPDVRVVRQAGGYLIDVEAMSVDLHRFRHLVREAGASGDEAAAALFDEACGLWRGTAFGSLDTPWLSGLRTAVDAERFAAELDRGDVELRLGRHTSLLPRLRAWSAMQPLDERLAGQSMIALYRCGRQADALDRYQQIRSRLAEELGADPSPALQRLHEQALRADPLLDSPGNADPPVRSPVPHQLPAPPQSFVGRARELAELDRAADVQPGTGARLVISAIGGAGGVGKTWLAVRWAHDNLDRFPDGQLYVNLRGFDPAGSPVPWPVAIRGFLDALGVRPAMLPVDPDAQAALYRSLVADKRMLVLLDNARDTAQVTPLLPGSCAPTVLVTSRRQLAGLLTAHGARPVELDVLPEPDARELLTSQLGAESVLAQQDAATELLTHCAGLPLAVSIVTARAAARPHFALSVLAQELREASARLDALDAGDMTANLRTTFSWSYDALAPAEAMTFGLLGLAPGPDIGLDAAASLAASPVATTRTVLRELHRAHLVQEHSPDRYRMHDLVHLYAIDRALRDQPEHCRRAALRRLVDFHLHTACAAATLLYPHRPAIDLDAPPPGCVPLPPADRAAAMAWFEANHACLLAAQHLALEQEWDAQVWKFAWALTIFHWRRGHVHEHLASWHTALIAADRLGDAEPRSHAHRLLGHAHGQSGNHAAAVEELGQALVLSEQCGDVFGQGHTHQLLAWTWSQQGDHRRAWRHAARVLRLATTLDNPVWTAIALETAGWCLAQLGHHKIARAHCANALLLHRRHHHREGEAEALNSLGYIAHHTGHHTEALHQYHKALILRRESGDLYAAADTLYNLAHTHLALGHKAEAHRAWCQALELYLTQGRTHHAERVQQQIDRASAARPWRT